MADYFEEVERRYDHLKQRGFSPQNKTPSRRLKLLEETADLLLEIEGWQATVDSSSLDTRKKQILNFTRAIGYRPSDLRRVADEKKDQYVKTAVPDPVPKQAIQTLTVVEPTQPSVIESPVIVEPQPIIPEPVRNAAYFKAGIQKIESLVQGKDRDAYCASYRDSSAFIEEFNGWYTALDVREKKKWNTQKMRLNGELNRALEVGLVYGFPPSLDWKWVLRSDDEARPYVDRMIADHGESGEQKLSHLRDKDHPNHPPWFVFLEGCGHFKMSVVARGKTKMSIGSKTTEEVFPWIGCHVYESSFERLDPAYWSLCVESLTQFVRGPEFSRTAYNHVIFNGLENRMPKELTAKLGLQEFETSGQKIGRYSYGCPISKPKPKFSLSFGTSGQALDDKIRSLFDKPGSNPLNGRNS